MHLETDEALFSGHSGLPLPLWFRCALLGTGLGLLLISASPYLVGGTAAFGLLMMIVERARWVRLLLPLLFLANLSILGFFWRLLGLTILPMLLPLAKAFAAACLLSWFGATVSWPQLKRRYCAAGWLSQAAEYIDHGVFHGQLLLSQVAKRFEAAFIRIGPAYKRPEPIALALSGGVAAAFDRSILIEEARRLRQPELNVGRTMSRHRLFPQVALDLDTARVTLEADGLGVASKEGVRLLERVNFSVAKGEWLFIGGPSGSGKTTLLRTICGLQAVSNGEVRVCGRAVRAGHSYPEVSLAFQNPDDQFFASTVREDLQWGLKYRGVEATEAATRCEEMLTRLGIAHLIDRPITQLSFGEKKRVAMAAILVTRPSILLCDEPTSGLDPVASLHLIELLEEVTSDKETIVLWVSHDLHLVPSKVTQVLLLNRGRQIAFCQPERAFSKESLELAGLFQAKRKPVTL